MKLLIKQARVIDEQTDAVCDVAIAASKIEHVGTIPASFTPQRTIEAKGLILTPGLWDICARLREPGYEHRSYLTTELNAAVAGGITAIVCPPDTDPALDEPAVVDMLVYRAKQQNKSHVLPLGALTRGLNGQVLAELAQLHGSGCVGFSHAADTPLHDSQLLMRSMQYAKTFGFTLWLSPQDAFLSKGGVAASGAFASRLGLPSVPVAAETVALHTIFELQRATGASVHIGRLSSAAGVALVREAKRQGLPVTADVSALHLHLIDQDIGYFDSNLRVNPPFRQQADRAALRAGLVDGTIDAICSDHNPVSDDEKLLPFAEAQPGATGLELLLSLTLKWAQEDQVPLSVALSKLTSKPAGITRITQHAQHTTNAGLIAQGQAADLCLFDPSAHWTPAASTLVSQGKHTPFLGYELPGAVRTTIVGGKVVFDN